MLASRSVLLLEPHAATLAEALRAVQYPRPDRDSRGADRAREHDDARIGVSMPLPLNALRADDQNL